MGTGEVRYWCAAFQPGQRLNLPLQKEREDLCRHREEESRPGVSAAIPVGVLVISLNGCPGTGPPS